ncbi:hypothetical protein HOY82DRAFT_607543 [Tuber indicum]|nr:hypothetical protein HOY82DRAFT_607543 [Tuber indicum]
MRTGTDSERKGGSVKIWSSEQMDCYSGGVTGRFTCASSSLFRILERAWKCVFHIMDCVIEIGSDKAGGSSKATEESFVVPTLRVPNSPTGQVLETGPDWPVLSDAVTGLD